MTGPWVVAILLTIFGGTWVDPDDIGAVFKTVGDIFPFAYALTALRSVMISGAELGDVTADLMRVLGYTIVMVGLAVIVFRRRNME